MAFKTFEILTVFPQFGAFSQQVTLGRSQWTLDFEWRERLRGWYVSIYDDEKVAVVVGRRLSVGANLAAGVLDFPGGLAVIGEEITKQSSLGNRTAVVYYEKE